MSTLVDLAEAAIVKGGGRLEDALLQSKDPRLVAEVLEGAVASTMAQPVNALFYRTSVGIVIGLQLADGSSVVLKVHRWNVSTERLASIQTVQRHLASEGLPAPRPLVPPFQLGAGIAVIEEYLPGQRPPASSGTVRASIAAGLCKFISAARPLSGAVDVGLPLMLQQRGNTLWHEPHDVRFDFDATAEGAEWIDEAARRARRRLHHTLGRAAIGHFDWRSENLGFEREAIVAIYDWDSVGCAPEPIIVGMCASQFCSDWTAGEVDPLPTVEEMLAFVSDYEAARGLPFSDEDRTDLDAANLWNVAYGARCQHSDTILNPESAAADDSCWFRLLRQRGDHLFDVPTGR